LHKQAAACGVAFEIVVMDDCSTDFAADNEKIKDLSCCRLVRLSENVGRARIRNKLAAVAVYDTLLFLDNDGAVVDGSFVKNYIPFCGKNCVVCGGRAYGEVMPGERYLWHWTYGRAREVRPVSEREKEPYQSFLSCNFLISRSLFLSLQFDEAIKLYGHEDTLFGIELQKRGVEICHIHNAIEHIGLEENARFIAKVKESVESLYSLMETYQNSSDLYEHIHLLQAYKKIKNYHLTFLLSLLSTSLFQLVKRTSFHPCLRCLDLFKLVYFCRLSR
jgi:glycosyltransferase involved in cell wall biosynthesis